MHWMLNVFPACHFNSQLGSHSVSSFVSSPTTQWALSKRKLIFCLTTIQMKCQRVMFWQRYGMLPTYAKVSLLLENSFGDVATATPSSRVNTTQPRPWHMLLANQDTVLNFAMENKPQVRFASLCLTHTRIHEKIESPENMWDWQGTKILFFCF